MRDIRFRIEGRPATFATARESEWKEAIADRASAPSLQGTEREISLDFTVPTLTPGGQRMDLDNLCEPVFSVLVNRVGWFGGLRPGIQAWHATIKEGVDAGCSVVMSPEIGPTQPPDEPLWDELYRGSLPASGTSTDLAQWAWERRKARGYSWVPVTCIVALEFGRSAINLGDIATGKVKSFIDCLYPWLGGLTGRPRDDRIRGLSISKSAPQMAENEVRVRLWAEGRDDSPLPPEPKTIHKSPDTFRKRKPQDGRENPCRPGSAKFVVVEAAFAEMPEAEARARLEQLGKGRGDKLREYISDVRSENRLDVRIEAGLIVFRGEIVKR